MQKDVVFQSLLNNSMELSIYSHKYIFDFILKWFYKSSIYNYVSSSCTNQFTYWCCWLKSIFTCIFNINIDNFIIRSINLHLNKIKPFLKKIY